MTAYAVGERVSFTQWGERWKGTILEIDSRAAIIRPELPPKRDRVVMLDAGKLRRIAR